MRTANDECLLFQIGCRSKLFCQIGIRQDSLFGQKHMTFGFRSSFGLLIVMSVAWAASTNAQETSPAKDRRAASHYVEFRAAQIGTYGHSYIAYGRLNAKGEPANVNYADLHPTGNYALMALGHVIPVPATTKWDPGVLELPVASSFRHHLKADEYARLVAAIQRARAKNSHQWNVATNNCNTFVAHLAETVGLRTPSNTVVPSYIFVPALRDLNDSQKRTKRARQ